MAKTQNGQRPMPKMSAAEEEEVDKQEREIIASLEMEEREHKKYMMRSKSFEREFSFQ